MTEKRVWLKSLRNEANYSISKLSKILNITPQYYWYIETNKRRPSPQLAQKMAKILDFDWKIFFEEK